MDTRRNYWIFLGVFLVVLCIGFILLAYHFNWIGTGFQNKTLWDWLQLLIVPLALALIAFLFNRTSTRTDQKIAAQRYEQDQKIAAQRYEQDQKIAAQRYEQDQTIALNKQREDLLQTYIDRMSELLLEKQLGSSPTDEVRNVARVRTITILFQLDARRIGYVFAFLREAGLMSNTSESIVSLKDADLSHINFNQAFLAKADLSGANLWEADLSGADLSGANLSGANLGRANLSDVYISGADLSDAYLEKANLSRAYLGYTNFRGADLSEADLSEANLHLADLSGAYLDNAKLDFTQITLTQMAQARPQMNA